MVSANPCTHRCWTAVSCPDHGQSMQPRGRFAPLEMTPRCDVYRYADRNPRHLWDEHDSDRAYTDPEGWDWHVRTCSRCKPEEEGDAA